MSEIKGIKKKELSLVQTSPFNRGSISAKRRQSDRHSFFPQGRIKPHIL